MVNYDGTGPLGQGALTGLGKGNCYGGCNPTIIRGCSDCKTSGQAPGRGVGRYGRKTSGQAPIRGVGRYASLATYSSQKSNGSIMGILLGVGVLGALGYVFLKKK